MKRWLPLVAFAVLFGMGVAGCRSSEGGDDMTPEKLAEFADVPLYPNAKTPDGVTLEPHKEDSGETRYEIVQVTGESPQAVAQWYEKKTGWSAQGSNFSWSLMGRTKKGNEAIVTIYPENDATTIKTVSLAHK